MTLAGPSWSLHDEVQSPTDNEALISGATDPTTISRHLIAYVTAGSSIRR